MIRQKIMQKITLEPLKKIQEELIVYLKKKTFFKTLPPREKETILVDLLIIVAESFIGDTVTEEQRSEAKILFANQGHRW